jgi:hypothetical protein
MMLSDKLNMIESTIIIGRGTSTILRAFFLWKDIPVLKNFVNTGIQN